MPGAETRTVRKLDKAPSLLRVPCEEEDSRRTCAGVIRNAGSD